MTKDQYLSKIYANEDQFQVATFAFINHNYPKTRKLCFHVANESATSDRMRMALAAKGLVAGIPDIVCVHPLFGMELKTLKGIQSEKQKAVEEKWINAGVPYYLCRSAKEVIDALTIIFNYL